MPDNVSCDIASLLLAWYDRNARVLPWRAAPHMPAADPYRVWLSEVMLQQTQVTTVIPYFERFTARWPDFASLAAAEDADLMSAWAGLGYYARARNLLACARTVVQSFGGRLPEAEGELRQLPGFGPYTAAAVAAIAFGQRAVVVDGNIERVVCRLFALREALPAAKARICALTDSITPDVRAGDFAQAMMDLGAGICTPHAPKCLLCPLAGRCEARTQGRPETYPLKAPKRARPMRYGTLFWAERDRRVLLVRRPARGLLGGMRALPTGPWVESPPGLTEAPFAADWALRNATVTHGFTHFELVCALASATIAAHSENEGEWWPVDDLAAAGLPRVFAKAAEAMRRMA